MSRPRIDTAGLRPQGAARRVFNRAVGTAFAVHAAAEVTEIDLYDEIGFWGVTAKDLRDELTGAGDVRLRINSPGGDVFDGIAMYNDLADHPGRISVEITGLAASAASIIAMAGDTVSIADNAFIMIHKAWGLTIGNADNHQETGAVLNQIDGALARTYAARAGGDADEFAEMMAAETWLAGEDAVAVGLADGVIAAATPQAAFDLSAFRHAPEALASVEASAKPSTLRDCERALRDAGWSRRDAKAMAGKAFAQTPALRDSGTDDAKAVATMRALIDTLRQETQKCRSRI